MNESNQKKFDALKAYHLPVDQYIITGSGPMGIRGLKEVNDLDLITTSDLFDELVEKFGIQKESAIEKVVFPDSCIEAFKESSFDALPSDRPTPKNRIKKAEILEGLPFDRLEHVLFFKYLMAREKDISDILAIERFNRQLNFDITFEKVQKKHKDTLFKWLDQEHIKEFWDNDPKHKEDIELFIENRKKPSSYFNGVFTYWIALFNQEPFAFIMSSPLKKEEPLQSPLKEVTQKYQPLFTLDFCIGNLKFLGQKLASLTLLLFMQFYKKYAGFERMTFLIDPDLNNPKATHVYEKAGFKKETSYLVEEGFFKGSTSWIMLKTL